MADKTIGELQAASEVYDDSLLVMEQQGEARSVQGALIKKYAREATAAYVEEARKSAEEGKGYRDAAAESARDAADVALHPPILKEENDHWWIWDTDLNDYTDSGIDAGVSLDIVEDIITGEPGTPASVANLGTKTDPRLQFTIPEGKKGDKGDAATIEVGEVTTGEPGTSASVKNSGTSGAAKLDFVIPQGPTGRGFTILGRYDSLDELNTAVQDPAVGDAYQVGTEMPYDVYIYDETEGWVNSGPINVDLPPHLIVGEDSELGTVLPVDADTLQGHSADYFVSDTELDEKFAKELPKKQDVLPYYSNKNMFDNWYFIDPVNQRGKKEYIEVLGIDRWSIYQCKQTLTDEGIIIEPGNETRYSGLFFQRVPRRDVFTGKQVTLSYLFSDGVLIAATGIVPMPSTQTVRKTFYDDGTWMVYAEVLAADSAYDYATFVIGNRVYGLNKPMVAAKLEFGPTQTLARKEGDKWVLNNPPPNYSAELQKCLRYQFAISPNTPIGVFHSDVTQITVLIPLQTTMRDRPSITGNNSVRLVYAINGSLRTVTKPINRISVLGQNILTAAILPDTENVPTGTAGYIDTFNAAGNLVFDANL